jgi:hypothetical protein
MAATRLLAELIDPESRRLDADAWRQAHADRTPVALCWCGGPCVSDPDEPEYREHFGVRWYALRCQSCTATSEVAGTREFPATDRRPSLTTAAAAAVIDRRILGEGTSE